MKKQRAVDGTYFEGIHVGAGQGSRTRPSTHGNSIGEASEPASPTLGPKQGSSPALESGEAGELRVRRTESRGSCIRREGQGGKTEKEVTVRATDAKEVGVGNPAEETYRHPNQIAEL